MKKILGVLIITVLVSPVFQLVDNLVWAAKQPGLPKQEYPLGFPSIPGMGALLLVTLVVGILGITIILSVTGKAES